MSLPSGSGVAIEDPFYETSNFYTLCFSMASLKHFPKDDYTHISFGDGMPFHSIFNAILT